MGTYLYGITRRDVPVSVGKGGVGDPPAPVRRVRYGDLAALVSDVDDDMVGEAAGVSGLRRDMAAHSDLLNRLIEETTVLPVRFGVIFPEDRTLIEDLLDPEHDQLLAYLDRVAGAVELSVRADYKEEAILAEVVREQPRLASGNPSRRSGSRTSFDARIEAGRRIAHAIRTKRDQDQQWLLQRLSPTARDVAVSDAASELAVLAASFLVDRRKLKQFDQALERVHEEVGDLMSLSCVGPLPPYSFVAVRFAAMI